LELMMVDRQLLGDLILAVLLAVPTAALARPEGIPQIRTAVAPTRAHVPVTALATAGDRQVGLFR
jgi:hypothetical protein